MSDAHAAETASSAILQLDSVSKSYGSVVATSEVSLEVERGEFVSLLGPSGSGKTTTLNLIAGFEHPDTGKVLLDGADVTKLPPNKRNVGMVLQGYALFPHMTVRQNVEFPLKARRVKGSHTQAVDDALAIVSLDGYANRRPRELSGGQQQRVALARSFVNRPPLLLMDEPLSALDRALRARMQTELRRIHREIGTTVIYVTHDQEEAMSLSDRVVVMQDAQVVQVGTPRDIYHSPKTKFVAEFVGKASVLPVRFGDGATDGSSTVAFTADGTRIQGQRTARTPGVGEGLAILRPEDGKLDVCADSSHNNFKIQVHEKIFLGDKVVCTGSFESGDSCEFWVPHEFDLKVQLGRPIVVGWQFERTALVET